MIMYGASIASRAIKIAVAKTHDIGYVEKLYTQNYV